MEIKECERREFRVPGSHDYDLRSDDAVVQLFADHKPDLVIYTWPQWLVALAQAARIQADSLTTAEHSNKAEPVNLGSGEEIKIHELANLIAELSGFGGRIDWDISQQTDSRVAVWILRVFGANSDFVHLLLFESAFERLSPGTRTQFGSGRRRSEHLPKHQ